MEYAIIKTGGKQYRVSPGDTVDVERLRVEEGALVELDVLALTKDGQLTVGDPIVPGAKVVATVQRQDKDKKIVIFKFKPKIRYRIKKGHRRRFSRLAIREITTEADESGGKDNGA